MGGEINEADLPVVSFHSIPDEIMGMILSTMLDGYDHLKGPIQTCQRFIEIYNNTQLYICPSLIQRPSRTCERIHCEDFHDILSHERFKHISELKLPIGVDGDITLQWLKSTLPNLGLVVNDDHILPSNHCFVRMHKIEIIFFSLNANSDNNHNHYLRSGFFEG